jgi:hypothetical protein
MPSEVRDRVAAADRYWCFVGNSIVVILIVALMFRNGVSAASVGLRLEGWRGGIAVGISTGVLLVLIQGLLVKSFPNAGAGEATDYLRRGGRLLWVLIFLAGAFAEELWIAFCLVVLRLIGHSMLVSIATTAVVFGAAHPTYKTGAIAVAIKGAVSALLFFWCGSLIPMFLFHFIGNLGSLYWLRRAGSTPALRRGGE